MNLPNITISKILSIFAKKEPKFKLQWYYLGLRDDLEKVLADFHDMLGETGKNGNTISLNTSLHMVFTTQSSERTMMIGKCWLDFKVTNTLSRKSVHPAT